MSPGKTIHIARTNRYGHSASSEQNYASARLQIDMEEYYLIPSIQEPLNFSMGEKPVQKINKNNGNYGCDH